MSVSDIRASRSAATARGAAHAASQAIERALRISGAPLFQQIVECSASCVMVIDAAADEQTIAYASPALQRLVGYGASDLVGADWGMFLSAREDDAPPGALREAVRRGSAAREILGAHRADGKNLYLDVRFAPLADETGISRLRVAILHDVTADHWARETLEHRACHDPLTGLANRYLLGDRFERAVCQAERHGAGLTLVLLDVDDFKQINDRHGHAAGDEVLRAVGARLTGLVRGQDTVARWGGDEFVLLLTEAGGPDAGRSPLKRIEASLARSARAGVGSIEARCSFGTANYPADGTALEALLETADRRLYTNKARRGVVPGGDDDPGS